MNDLLLTIVLALSQGNFPASQTSQDQVTSVEQSSFFSGSRRNLHQVKEVMERSYYTLASTVFTPANELKITTEISDEASKTYGEMAELLKGNETSEALHLNTQLEGILKSYKDIFEKTDSTVVTQRVIDEERRAVSVKEQFAQEYEQGIIDSLTIKEAREMIENDIMDARKEFIQYVDTFTDKKTEEVEAELTAAEQIVLQADAEADDKNYKRAFDYFAEAETHIYTAYHIIATD